MPARPSAKRTADVKTRRLKAARLSMRIDPPSKAKLERAAAYNDESVSDYVIARALYAADADIKTHEKTVLAAPVWNAFFDALKHPPRPNANLKELLKRHDQEVVSR